jgi:glycosyltransferase involved in cell wall biosynthesis
MSSFNPLVSVILPCYNADAFVEAAVISIMDQTYRNLEIIIINDCSTDKTPGILEMLAEKDPRIKIIHNEKNYGLVTSLNKGIANANGKYIARMDADDISLTNRIEMQVDFMESNSDVALCGSNYIIIDDKNTQIGKIEFPSEDRILKTELLFMCPFGHPTVMIKKEIFEQCGYYEDIAPSEDYELWVRISKGHRVGNIPGYLLKYRWHGNNITIVQHENHLHTLEKAINRHAASFGFADSFLTYHLKFVGGAWNMKSSIEEINGFKKWKKALLEKNLKTGLMNEKVLVKVFDKYYSNALLSIIKSDVNTYQVKLHAFIKLLSINPLITMKHFIRKIG